MAARGKVTSTDRFPNFLTGRLTESAADTFTTAQVFTPIPRLKTVGNKATVMELLYMETDLQTTLNAAQEAVTVSFSLGSVPTAMLVFNDPRVFARRETQMMLLTSGAIIQNDPVRQDLQSTDGFGYLLASDAFNVSILGTNTGVANQVDWKLFYRFVDIPLSEFVGLVQSVQQS